MPIITEREYISDNTFSNAIMSDLKESKDILSEKSSLNEIMVVVNSYERYLSNDKTAIRDGEEQSLINKDNINTHENEKSIQKQSSLFIPKNPLCFIGSIIGLVLIGTVGRTAYRMINQERAHPAQSTNLLELTSPLDAQGDTSVNRITGSGILPLEYNINSQSFHAMESHVSNDISFQKINLSLHEYLKEMNIIENLTVFHVDSLYSMVFHREERKRFLRSVDNLKINNISVSSEILGFINNQGFDWRIRNELQELYVKAAESIEIKNENEGQIKDVKLIIACIGVTLQYLYENKINNLSRVSFIYGVFFIDRIFLILDSMDSAGLGAVDSRFKTTVKLLISDIYSNKKNNENDHRLEIFREEDSSVSMLHDRTQDFFYYAIRNHILPKKEVATVAPQEENVKYINLVFCQVEREHLTLSDILRSISKTIKDPISSMIDETRIVYNYIMKNEGCSSDERMIDIATKTSEVLDSLMSWVPTYNRVRLISLILASSIELIADSMEEKELSLDKIIEINGYILNLSKDIFSSLSTKQMSDFEFGSENTNDKIKEMTSKIKFKGNELNIEIENPKRTILIDDKYHNFVDRESKHVIYYGASNNWYVSEDIRFTHETKNILEKLLGSNLEEHDIYLIKNSSPTLYADGTLIMSNGKKMVIVGGGIYPVSEYHISDGIYRYVVLDGESFRPIINSAGKWIFEKQHSPYAGEDIIGFFSFNNHIRNKLVSNSITDADVTPERLSTKVQYDSTLNEYIKVNNEYYLLKTDAISSDYIEGHYDILPLAFSSNRFHMVNDISGDMYFLYKKALMNFSGIDKQYYFDSSVIKQIHIKDIYHDSKELVDIDPKKIRPLSKFFDIEGGVSIEGRCYLAFEGKLIDIHANGDDTFLLGNEIKIYKNNKGNTYYFISDDTDIIYKTQRFKMRNAGCLLKRQVSPLCSTSFYESRDVSAILKRNAVHSVNISNPQESLRPYEDFIGFYKEKNEPDTLYFLSKEGLFYYAKEEVNSDSMVPRFSKIYGKSHDGMDSDIVITDICIIKDFDTYKTIITTPLEAMRMIFNLNEEVSKSFLQWERDKISRQPFDNSFKQMEAIQKKLSDDFDVLKIKDFYSFGGKKIVSSINYSERYINGFMRENFVSMDRYDYKDLQVVESESSPPLIAEIFTDAFHKTKYNIKNAISTIHNNNDYFNDYLLYKLRIKDKNARDLFGETLLIKLKRMGVVFNDNDKSNIVLILDKKEGDILNDNLESGNNNEIVGFSYSNDPLDRMYIKTSFIDHAEYETMSEVEQIKKRKEYTEMLSDIMTHESIHVLGRSEDFFYHSTDKSGHYDVIEESLARAEIYIRKNREISDELLHVCKLYFMNNPVYNCFELDSLLTPENLSLLFHFDDYLRGIILINNPDTVSAVVNDLALMT